MPKRRHRSEHERIAESLRGWGQQLGIYHLCDNKACRRAKICRGEARSCFRERFHQLPEQVRHYWFLLLAAKEDGLTWDEMLEQMLPRPELAAWSAWMKEIDESSLPNRDKDDVAPVDQRESATT